MIASDEIWPAGRFEHRAEGGESGRSRREMMSFSHAATNRPNSNARQEKKKKQKKKNGDKRYLYIV